MLKTGQLYQTRNSKKSSQLGTLSSYVLNDLCLALNSLRSCLNSLSDCLESLSNYLFSLT